jgi:hypothetical protein
VVAFAAAAADDDDDVAGGGRIVFREYRRFYPDPSIYLRGVLVWVLLKLVSAATERSLVDIAVDLGHLVVRIALLTRSIDVN